MSACPVNRKQALAFRLRSHNLAVRQERSRLLVAAGACGVQNTPPGSAPLALHARVEGLAPDDVDKALKAKTLLQAWSVRAAPRFFPTTDLAVFTLGLLGTDERSIRSFIFGVEPALEKIGISVSEVIELGAKGLLEELDGRALTKDELGIRLARWVLPHLVARQRAHWQAPSWYAPRQTLGESVVRFALPVLALRGLCCHGERSGNKAYIVRTDQWLGGAPSQANLNRSRAELARRYVHCYGPCTMHTFAEWAGIDVAQAATAWRSLEQELEEVDFDGTKSWIGRGDLKDLASATMPKGVRFLPPHDPFLESRDRETFVPEKGLQQLIWRAVGNPGVLMVDGQFAGTWRSTKKGKRLHFGIDRFGALSRTVRAQVEAEAAALAPLKRCESVEIEFRRA